MTYLLLCSYVDGSVRVRRGTDKAGQHRLYLPQTQWFKSRLASVQMCQPSQSHWASIKFECKAVGLIQDPGIGKKVGACWAVPPSQVAAKSVIAPHTPCSEEEFLMLHYYGFQHAYSAEIQQTWPLQETLLTKRVCCSKKAGDRASQDGNTQVGVSKVVTHGCFIVNFLKYRLPNCDFMVLAGSNIQHDLLFQPSSAEVDVYKQNLPVDISHSEMLCLALPGPIVTLIMEGLWRTIVCPRLFAHRIFPAFPSENWFQETDKQKKTAIVDNMTEMTYSNFNAFIEKYTHWTTQLDVELRPAVAPEGQPVLDTLVHDMKAQMLTLQSMLRTLDPLPSSSRHGNCADTERKHATCVMLAHMLSDKTRHLPEALSLLSRGGFTKVALQQDCPSKSVLRRKTFQMHVAYNLVLAKRLQRHTEPPVRFAWIDSSPVRGLNFLMSKYTEVLHTDVTPVAKAANILSRQCALAMAAARKILQVFLMQLQQCNTRDIDGSDSGVDVDVHVLDRVTHAQKLLLVKDYMLTPVLLGGNRAASEHKAAAFAFQLYLESFSSATFKSTLAGQSLKK
eukprot:6472408-Amphidinium_carterae.1